MKLIIALASVTALSLGGLNLAHASSGNSGKKSAQEMTFMNDAQMHQVKGELVTLTFGSHVTKMFYNRSRKR